MIILCSNGLTSPELLRAAGQHVKAGGRAAIVVTADPEYKEKNYHVGRERKRLELLGLTVDLFDFDTQPAGALAAYDVVELNGGNPYYLLDSIRKHQGGQALRQVAERGLLIGWSAGALVLQRGIGIANRYISHMNFLNLDDFTGLGLTDVQILPHYSKQQLRDSGTEEKCRQYERETGCEVIRLNDGDGIVLDGSPAVIRSALRTEVAGVEFPRVTETPAGMLNAVGLQNPGVDHFIEHDLPWLNQQGTRIIANLAGSAVEDYCQTAEKLNDAPIDMIELNISCPNVKEGGVQFGVTAQGVEGVTKAVRKVCQKPLMVKLSPNVTDISEMALAAESAGADAVSLINTLTGMRIDINTRRPIIRNNTGGLSGPAVLPVALRMVWQTAQKVKIPIVGLGGISTWQDAVEMLLAGASAIQVGTAIFTDPYAPIKIRDGLLEYMEKNGVRSVSQLTGGVRPW